MLVDVVAEGTGTAAAIANYTVAGKTGTARKPKDDALGYTDGAYVASFAGFVPAAAPRLSAIVVLDEPTPDLRRPRVGPGLRPAGAGRHPAVRRSRPSPTDDAPLRVVRRDLAAVPRPRHRSGR